MKLFKNIAVVIASLFLLFGLANSSFANNHGKKKDTF